MELTTTYTKMLADTHTPVSMYLKLRDVFPQSILLESSDYHASDKSFSYLCCHPIAEFKVENQELSIEKLGHKTTQKIGKEKGAVISELKKFIDDFKVEKQDFPFLTSGLFGYTGFDAVQYFEKIESNPNRLLKLPQLHYKVYQTVIVVDHFRNQLYIFDHSPNQKSNLERVKQTIKQQSFHQFPFHLKGPTTSPISDDYFKEMVSKAKQHCQQGDVFQMVVSRRFTQKFHGDEFNVYRSLRSINPSPYLFYFDFGSYKIFGSSPEAQLVVQGNQAEIHPIAGTFKRTGNDAEDATLAKKLSQDPKENSEHVMLVDLARNDLSQYAHNVEVKKYKEIQYFSHVIHLVSKVIGEIKNKANKLPITAATFPAGTLSGAPKYKALELINRYEPHAREIYGGAIGAIDFEHNYNHAIVIRSFVSQNQALHFQAGAGVVVDSNEEKELAEVNHKLNALTTALKNANHETKNE